LFGIAVAGETGVSQVLRVMKEESHIAQMPMGARSLKVIGAHRVRTHRDRRPFALHASASTSRINGLAFQQ
jgi:hypothetical protein